VGGEQRESLVPFMKWSAKWGRYFEASKGEAYRKRDIPLRKRGLQREKGINTFMKKTGRRGRSPMDEHRGEKNQTLGSLHKWDQEQKRKGRPDREPATRKKRKPTDSMGEGPLFRERYRPPAGKTKPASQEGSQLEPQGGSRVLSNALQY